MVRGWLILRTKNRFLVVVYIKRRKLIFRRFALSPNNANISRIVKCDAEFCNAKEMVLFRNEKSIKYIYNTSVKIKPISPSQ